MLGIVDGAYNGSETWDDALDASHGLGLTYPSVWDANGKFVQYLRVPGIPVSIFVDAVGRDHARQDRCAGSRRAREVVGAVPGRHGDGHHVTSSRRRRGWRRCCKQRAGSRRPT